MKMDYLEKILLSGQVRQKNERKKLLTVGKLKQALTNISDDLKVELWSDSGVYQCDFDDYGTVIEDACTNKDSFIIYANYRELEEG